MGKIPGCSPLAKGTFSFLSKNNITLLSFQFMALECHTLHESKGCKAVTNICEDNSRQYLSSLQVANTNIFTNYSSQQWENCTSVPWDQSCFITAAFHSGWSKPGFTLMNTTGQVFNSFKPAGHMVALHFFVQKLSSILCSNLGQWMHGNTTVSGISVRQRRSFQCWWCLSLRAPQLSSSTNFQGCNYYCHRIWWLSCTGFSTTS